MSELIDQMNDIYRSLEKVIELLDYNDHLYQQHSSPSVKDKFWVKIRKGEFEAIPYKDIVIIKSDGHYNDIHINNKKHPTLIKGALKTELYDVHFRNYSNFFLLSKSIIINRDYILRVGGNLIFLDANINEQIRRLKIPRGKKPDILKHLKIRN